MVEALFGHVMLVASRSGLVRAAVTRTRLARGIVDRFVAGDTAEEVLRVVGELGSECVLATVDRLGEHVTDAARARENTDAYLGLLDLAARADLSAGLDVSVKLSAVGQALPADGRKISYENAMLICQRAGAHQATVTLDMEDHTTTDATLTTHDELRRDFGWVGVALQARLRRTEGDCRSLAAAGARVRLCKGAYLEPASVAFTGNGDVLRSFARCLGILMASDAYPMVATHDPELIRLAGQLAAHRRRDPAAHEYQMLYGVRPAEQRRLVATGARVRAYLPYGPEWYPYLTRRLAERPANLALLLRALVSRH
jgi:proline dehydrogenase